MGRKLSHQAEVEMRHYGQSGHAVRELNSNEDNYYTLSPAQRTQAKSEYELQEKLAFAEKQRLAKLRRLKRRC